MLYSAILRVLPRTFRIRAYEQAVKTGHFKRALAILNSGAISGPQGQIILPISVKLGTEALLRKLLLLGAKANSSQLIVDARHSKLEPFGKMRALVQAGADVNGFTGPKRLKLLNSAILNRDAEFFHFLMEQKADTQVADRNDLLPLQAARLVEQRSFEKVLETTGASTASSPLLKILESLVINENALFSELHELLKWSFKNSRFEIVRTTLPETGLLRYRILHQQFRLRVELRFVSNQEITLLLFQGEEVMPLRSLLPPTGKIDSTTLRGNVVTELIEFLKLALKPGYQRPRTDPEKSQSAITAEDKALQILGLEKGAEEKEIISAYRALAKRYHPDVSPRSGDKMVVVNKAYETLRKNN